MLKERRRKKKSLTVSRVGEIKEFALLNFSTNGKGQSGSQSESMNRKALNAFELLSLSCFTLPMGAPKCHSFDFSLVINLKVSARSASDLQDQCVAL